MKNFKGILCILLAVALFVTAAACTNKKQPVDTSASSGEYIAQPEDPTVSGEGSGPLLSTPSSMSSNASSKKTNSKKTSSKKLNSEAAAILSRIQTEEFKKNPPKKMDIFNYGRTATMMQGELYFSTIRVLIENRLDAKLAPTNLKLAYKEYTNEKAGTTYRAQEIIEAVKIRSRAVQLTYDSKQTRSFNVNGKRVTRKYTKVLIALTGDYKDHIFFSEDGSVYLSNPYKYSGISDSLDAFLKEVAG